MPSEKMIYRSEIPDKLNESIRLAMRGNSDFIYIFCLEIFTGKCCNLTGPLQRKMLCYQKGNL